MALEQVGVVITGRYESQCTQGSPHVIVQIDCVDRNEDDVAESRKN